MALASLIFVGVCYGLQAQEVEHNFLVGPQSTNCDSLRFDGMEKAAILRQLEESKFRTSENFVLRRKSGLRAASFYSCDNKTGYLVIRYNDDDEIYLDVPLETWQSLTKNADPDGFYLQSIDPVYKKPYRQ